MKKTLLFIITVLLTSNLFAQNDALLPDCKCNTVDELIQLVFESNVQEAKQFLGADSDPFGIKMSVKVRIQQAGDANASAYTSFNIGELEAAAQELVNDQLFNQFDMENPGHGQKMGDVWIYEVGVVPHGDVPKDSREHHVVSKDYHCNISMNQVKSGVHIESLIIITGKTPANGGIQVDVKAYEKNGAVQDWRTAVWGGSPQMVYKRIGPGNSDSNSEKGEDIWKQGSSHVTMDAVYNPGYYLPIIKHRKCEQDFTQDRDRFKSMEVLLKLASTHQAETKEAPAFQTYFSRGNTVSGTVYDPEGKPVKEGIVVRINPDGWDLPTPVEPVKTTFGGKYKFDKNIETGVYKVFTEDNPEGGEVVKVCNCPQKDETFNKVYDNVDINDQTDLTFLIECNETYSEDIEPLVLEGATSSPGKVNRSTIGYSVIRIQSKVVKDFFEEMYINNVIGAPAEDKDRIVSFNSETYSFDAGAIEEKDRWIKTVRSKADYDGGATTAFIFPEKKIDGKLADSDLLLLDSIWNNNKMIKKLQNKSWNLFAGGALIEGKGLDIEVINHKEAQPLSLRELKDAKEKKATIVRSQLVEYKKGYNTNFVGLGTLDNGKYSEDLEPIIKLMEDPTQVNQALAGMEQINPEMARLMKQNQGHQNIGVFLRSAFGKDKYSGMFESWASRIKKQRTITIRPITALEADKYLTSGKAFEITGVKTEESIDPDQLKDVLKSLFK